MARKSKSSAPAPAWAWSSLAEHAIKAALYASIVVHAVRSALRSDTPFSRFANVAVGLLALRAIACEVDLAIKRIRLRFPPGYIGFPVIRDVRFLRAAIGGDGHLLRAMWEESREKYGTVFARWNVFGRIQVALCGPDDLAFLFQCDRRGQTEVCWPRNIAMLLGPEGGSARRRVYMVQLNGGICFVEERGARAS